MYFQSFYPYQQTSSIAEHFYEEEGKVLPLKGVMSRKRHVSPFATAQGGALSPRGVQCKSIQSPSGENKSHFFFMDSNETRTGPQKNLEGWYLTGLLLYVNQVRR